MAISIVRLGSERAKDEGPRLGTVRRPPRGVPKREFARQNYYDTWLPNLAPSAALMAQMNIVKDRRRWAAFEKRFLAELKQPDAARLLDALATLSHTAHFAIGCYCENERFCHRSILRRALIERGATVR